MNKKLPLISIVIPVYNSENILYKSIESAIDQTYENLEIILINDGSTDKSEDICKKYSIENENIKFFDKKNGGASTARNLALNNISGKFVVFLDSDDFLEQNAIFNLYNVYKETLSDAIIPNRYYFIKNNKISIKKHFYSEDFKQNPINFIISIMIDKGRAWRSTSVLYKTEIIKNNQIRYPEGIIMEDFFFNLDYFESCKKLAQLETPTLYNLRRDNSVSNTFNIDSLDIYLKIDGRITDFLRNNNLESYENINIRKQLLLRNFIIFLKDLILSDKYSCRKFILMINNYQKNNQIRECFSTKNIDVYYNNPLAIIYLKIAHFLLKNNKYCLLYYFTKLIKIIK